MYLIVRTSDLPLLTRRRANAGPLKPEEPFAAPPHLAPDAAHERALEARELGGCCGCLAPPEVGIAQAVRRAPEPMGAAPPAPLSPPPVPPFFGDLDALGAQRLERRVDGIAQRVGALEAHVQTLENAIVRRDEVERAEVAELERAEDSVFAAFIGLLSSMWERRRLERRASRSR